RRGASPPFWYLPPGTLSAGQARARSGTPDGRRSLRIERHLEERVPGKVVERDRHDLGLAVDGGQPEILAALRGRPVRLHAHGHADVARLGPERAVDLVRAEAAGVDRAGDELPERVEVGEGGPARVVAEGRRVVHVGR